MTATSFGAETVGRDPPAEAAAGGREVLGSGGPSESFFAGGGRDCGGAGFVGEEETDTVDETEVGLEAVESEEEAEETEVGLSAALVVDSGRAPEEVW